MVPPVPAAAAEAAAAAATAAATVADDKHNAPRHTLAARREPYSLVRAACACPRQEHRGACACGCSGGNISGRVVAQPALRPTV